MELSTKKILIGSVVLVVASVAATRYLWPQVLVTEHETIKNNIVTVTKTIKDPGGVVETVTTITDRSEKQTVESRLDVKPQWRIGGGMDSEKNYHVQVERRILGPAFITLGGTSQGVIRLGVAVEF